MLPDCFTADHRQTNPSRQPFQDITNGSDRTSRSDQHPRETGLTPHFAEDETFEAVR